MKNQQLINFLAGTAFVVLAVFLALILFIRPEFLEPVTTWVHSFGVITIGSFSFSIGGTAAIILFFGFVIPAAYGLNKKKS